MQLSFQMLPEQPAPELLNAFELADGLGYYGGSSAAEIYHKNLAPLIVASIGKLKAAETTLKKDYKESRTAAEAVIDGTTYMQEVVGGLATLFGLLVAFLIGLVYGGSSSGARKKVLERLFGQRISQKQFNALVNAEIPANFPGALHEGTVIVCEVHNHRELMEVLTPENYAAMTNLYLQTASDFLVEIGGYLDLVERDEGNFEVARHGLDGRDPIARIVRLDALLAGDERDLVGAGTLDEALIDLACEKAQRQADQSRGVAQHALDGEMGLAGIGGAEDGGDAARPQRGRQRLGAVERRCNVHRPITSSIGPAGGPPL